MELSKDKSFKMAVKNFDPTKKPQEDHVKVGDVQVCYSARDQGSIRKSIQRNYLKAVKESHVYK